MNLVRLRHYNILPEVELAKSLLENNGLRACCKKTVCMWVGVSLIKGINLFIDDND